MRIHASFVRVRILFRRDLFFFMVGLTLMTSVLSGSMSFITGLGNQELYLGEMDDVVILAQSRANTPITGHLPIVYRDVLQVMRGVEAVSSEVIGIGVISPLEITVTYRGILKDFFNIQAVKVRFLSSQEGEPSTMIFDPTTNDDSIMAFPELFGEGIVRGILIGERLVKKGIIPLTKNDDGFLVSRSSFTLFGTMSNVKLSLDVLGTFETNTTLDEEILIPLAAAQSLNGLKPTRVTLHRIRIDPSIIDPLKMKEFLDRQFTVKFDLNFLENGGLVHVNSLYQQERFSNLMLLDRINEPLSLTLKVRTRDGVLIDALSVEMTNQTSSLEMSLPLGVYRAELLVNGKTSAIVDFSVGDQPFLMDHPSTPIVIPIELSLPKNYFLLQVTWNDRPLSNVQVQLQSLSNKSIQAIGSTNESGMVFFKDLSEELYSLNVMYQSLNEQNVLTWQRLIDLRKVNELTLIGTGRLQVQVTNITTGGSLTEGVIIVKALNITSLKMTNEVMLKSSRGINAVNMLLKTTNGRVMEVSSSNDVQSFNESRFNLTGTQEVSVPVLPGVYEVSLEINGSIVPTAKQIVTIGDDGFNDTESVAFTIGKPRLMVTVTSSLDLTGHHVNVTLARYQGSSFLVPFFSRIVTMNQSRQVVFDDWVGDVTDPQKWLLTVRDVDESYQNAVNITLTASRNITLPLLPEYNFTVQLQNVTGLLDVKNARVNVNDFIVEAKIGSRAFTNFTMSENGTLHLSLGDFRRSVNITIIIPVRRGMNSWNLTETFELDPYTLYDTTSASSLTVLTIGGTVVILSARELDSQLSLNLTSAVLWVNMSNTNSGNDSIRYSEKLQRMGEVWWAFIPSLGDFSLQFDLDSRYQVEGSVSELHHEINFTVSRSGLVRQEFGVFLSPPRLHLVDLNGIPVGDAYYEMYQLGDDEIEEQLIQQGYTDSDGIIALRFVPKHSVTYLLKIQFGEALDEVRLTLQYYVKDVVVEISVHVALFELENPYKFISTSEVFLGDVSSYLDEVFEGSIRLLRMTLNVMVLLLGALGSASLVSLVGYALAQHRRHYEIVRMLGGTPSMVATSVSTQVFLFSIPALLIGVMMGNVAIEMMFQISPANIAGLIIEPTFDLASQVTLSLVLLLTVTLSSYFQVIGSLKRRGIAE